MVSPVPEHLHIEFIAFVEMADDETLSDGAWWAVLQDTCQMFFDSYQIKGDAFEAVHQYLRLKYPENPND